MSSDVLGFFGIVESIDFAYRSLISVVGFEFTLCEIFYFFQYFSTSTTGDIISFYQEHTLVTHRVIERNRDYLQTRGDQNNVNDLIAVTKANYLGKYQFRIKQLGRFLLWMQDPLVYSLIMAAIALRIAVLLLFKK